MQRFIFIMYMLGHIYSYFIFTLHVQMNNEPFTFNANAPVYYPGTPYNVEDKNERSIDSNNIISENINDGDSIAEVENKISKMCLTPEKNEEIEVAKVEKEIQEDKGVDKKVNLVQVDSRPHLNIIFIGHVDAGKSTACGNILYILGYVDDRTIEKYEREAKEKNRESWFLAFIMDINEEERQKGKTVEVGRAHFETKDRRFTILDAPGHKNFIPNMISGAAQADIGVLIISARKGEFETGFERGGQTREHTLLAKTLGKILQKKKYNYS